MNTAKVLSLAVARKFFLNLTVVVVVLAFGFMVTVNAPKESVVRPGLSDADQRVLCERGDAIRIECDL